MSDTDICVRENAKSQQGVTVSLTSRSTIEFFSLEMQLSSFCPVLLIFLVSFLKKGCQKPPENEQRNISPTEVPLQPIIVMSNFSLIENYKTKDLPYLSWQ